MPAPDVTLPGISKAGLLRPDHKLQPLGCLLISTSGTIGHVDSRVSSSTTGRFIVYEDGGRPLEVLYFKSGNKVALAELLHIARDLLEALIYLLDRRVVHRNLNPGTVVYRADSGVKLIAL